MLTKPRAGICQTFPAWPHCSRLCHHCYWWCSSSLINFFKVTKSKVNFNTKIILNLKVFRGSSEHFQLYDSKFTVTYFYVSRSPNDHLPAVYVCLSGWCCGEMSKCRVWHEWQLCIDWDRDRDRWHWWPRGCVPGQVSAPPRPHVLLLSSGHTRTRAILQPSSQHTCPWSLYQHPRGPLDLLQ